MAGLVRVHAGGAEQPLAAVQAPAQAQRFLAVAEAGAGDHHLHHAGAAGALDEGFLLWSKAWVSKVDADIDQLHGAFPGFGQVARIIE
ncbi:hypothetical protein D3C80_1734030 [compost metagenome]